MKKHILGVFMLTGILLCACSKEEASAEMDLVQQEISEQDNTEMMQSKDIIIIEQANVAESKEKSSEIIDFLSKLPKQEFTAAIKYEDDVQDAFAQEHVVILAQDETEKIIIYGYESSENGPQGMIVYNDGIYSYFDYSWNREQGRRNLFVNNLNHDGVPEIYFLFQGPVGTGVNIERLIVFEPDSENNGLKAFEFEGRIQSEKLREILKFYINADDQMIIYKNGTEEKIIDLKKYGNMPDKGIYGIDYLNQINYSITDDKVLMNINIGIWLEKGGPVIYSPDNAGRMSFEVTYSNGNFELK